MSSILMNNESFYTISQHDYYCDYYNDLVIFKQCINVHKDNCIPLFYSAHSIVFDNCSVGFLDHMCDPKYYISAKNYVILSEFISDDIFQKFNESHTVYTNDSNFYGAKSDANVVKVKDDYQYYHFIYTIKTNNNIGNNSDYYADILFLILIAFATAVMFNYLIVFF